MEISIRDYFTTYDIGDGITGIIGQVGDMITMMQFVPLADPGAASSNGNFPTPEVITIDDLNDSFDDYEAELVQLLDVTFADADGDTTFVNGEVYPISDRK